MAEVNVNQTEIVADELRQIADVVALAAFAAEARRTLEAIEEVSRALPEEQMLKHVQQACPAWMHWSTLDDVTGAVLQDAALRLNAIVARLDA